MHPFQRTGRGRIARAAQRRLPLARLLVALAAASIPAPGFAARSISPKVLVLNYDPRIQSAAGRPLHEVGRWHDPRALTQGYIDDVRNASGGYVRYRVVAWRDLDAFPLKQDGFRYTEREYLAALRARAGWHQPDAVDYAAVLRDGGVPALIDSGAIDEVWVWSMPYSGFYESTMAGPTAYFCNSDPLPGVATSRNFVVMGFNYERGVGEMLEDMGHRTESIMTHVYGSWEPKATHPWNRFTLYDRQIREHPELAGQVAGCGNVHFAPNSRKDYDWGNPAPVWSACDEWRRYPRRTGGKRLMTAADWGGGDIRKHHVWWLSHLPRAGGRSGGRLNNWWAYAVDFNRYPESRR